MPAGTMALTNNSTAVTGSGTSFKNELKSNDFIFAIIGGTPYTLGIASVNSDTSITLTVAYKGPSTSGAAWNAIPNQTLVGLTAQVVTDTAYAIRGLNYDKANWQGIYSNAASVTIIRPDMTTFTGPSWGYISSALNSKLASDSVTLRKLFTSAFVNPGENWQYPGVSTYNNNLWGSISKWGTVLTLSNMDVSGNGADGRWFSHIQIDTGGNVAFAANINSTFFGSYLAWTTKNTTVDSNGFIKKASPVVKLLRDGACETNEESEGVITERISEGVYRVSGTMGFNSDAGWGGPEGGIGIPKCRNSLALIWLDYEVDANGDLLIKTYHRSHSDAPAFARNVIEGYEDGAPIDIPDGRWVDLRVEMPENSIFNKKMADALATGSGADAQTEK